MAEELKEVVFDESQLEDLSAVAQQLFFSGKRPNEPGYQRVLVRPAVHWGSIAVNCLLTVAACGMLLVVVGCAVSWPVALWVTAGAMAVYLCLRMKSIIITLVRMYQRYAPEAIRDRCLFEPTCSEYMIGAVQKYGVCRGVCRGVKRLCRCNVKHGGYDEP